MSCVVTCAPKGGVGAPYRSRIEGALTPIQIITRTEY